MRVFLRIGLKSYWFWRTQPPALAVARMASRDGCLHALQELLALKGLAQIRDGAHAQRRVSRLVIIVRRDEDDRHLPILADQLPLKLQPAHPRQSQVEN